MPAARPFALVAKSEAAEPDLAATLEKQRAAGVSMPDPWTIFAVKPSMVHTAQQAIGSESWDDQCAESSSGEQCDFDVCSPPSAKSTTTRLVPQPLVSRQQPGGNHNREEMDQSAIARSRLGRGNMGRETNSARASIRHRRATAGALLKRGTSLGALTSSTAEQEALLAPAKSRRGLTLLWRPSESGQPEASHSTDFHRLARSRTGVCIDLCEEEQEAGGGSDEDIAWEAPISPSTPGRLASHSSLLQGRSLSTGALGRVADVQARVDVSTRGRPEPGRAVAAARRASASQRAAAAAAAAGVGPRLRRLPASTGRLNAAGLDQQKAAPAAPLRQNEERHLDGRAAAAQSAAWPEPGGALADLLETALAEAALAEAARSVSSPPPALAVTSPPSAFARQLAAIEAASSVASTPRPLPRLQAIACADASADLSPPTRPTATQQRSSGAGDTSPNIAADAAPNIRERAVRMQQQVQALAAQCGNLESLTAASAPSSPGPCAAGGGSGEQAFTPPGPGAPRAPTAHEEAMRAAGAQLAALRAQRLSAAPRSGGGRAFGAPTDEAPSETFAWMRKWVAEIKADPPQHAPMSILASPDEGAGPARIAASLRLPPDYAGILLKPGASTCELQVNTSLDSFVNDTNAISQGCTLQKIGGSHSRDLLAARNLTDCRDHYKQSPCPQKFGHFPCQVVTDPVGQVLGAWNFAAERVPRTPMF